MITFEELRAALESPERYREMDKLVRRELAIYRTTREITGNLTMYWEQAEAIPGFENEMIEAMGGSIDALTGMCHRDCLYHTIPKPDELQSLENDMARRLGNFPVETQLSFLDSFAQNLREAASTNSRSLSVSTALGGVLTPSSSTSESAAASSSTPH